PLHNESIVGFAEPDTGGAFGNGSLLNGKDGPRFALPVSLGDDAIAFKVRGDSMLPLYRNEDIIIVAPSIPLQEGDRVVVRMTAGEMLVKTLVRTTPECLEVLPLNG